MQHIIMVQHTQSEHHTNGMVGSWTDWALTAHGKEQAERIGRRLGNELAGKDVVLYSSDLKRAAQTAEAIAAYLGIEPILRRELRERNLGRCCGKSVQWLRGHMERPEKTIDDRLFSDGESVRDAWNRLRPFYEEVLSGGEPYVILVTHGELLRIFLAMFRALAAESLSNTDVRGNAGGVSHLTVDDDGSHRVIRFNDLSYLSEEN
jgi:probable phosphoglycerate mutase